jgi:hypothetical protein
MIFIAILILTWLSGFSFMFKLDSGFMNCVRNIAHGHRSKVSCVTECSPLSQLLQMVSLLLRLYVVSCVTCRVQRWRLALSNLFTWGRRQSQISETFHIQIRTMNNVKKWYHFIYQTTDNIQNNFGLRIYASVIGKICSAEFVDAAQWYFRS